MRTRFGNKVALNLKNHWNPTQNTSPSVPLLQTAPPCAAAVLVLQLPWYTSGAFVSGSHCLSNIVNVPCSWKSRCLTKLCDFSTGSLTAATCRSGFETRSCYLVLVGFELIFPPQHNHAQLLPFRMLTFSPSSSSSFPSRCESLTPHSWHYLLGKLVVLRMKALLQGVV